MLQEKESDAENRKCLDKDAHGEQYLGQILSCVQQGFELYRFVRALVFFAEGDLFMPDLENRFSFSGTFP